MLMAYTSLYAGADLGPITIDILASLGVFIVSIASIFAIVIAYRFLKTGSF